MQCKFKKQMNEINFDFSFSLSDACIISTYGDANKIRDGIEELDFKP
jgi:hypothetical protein